MLLDGSAERPWSPTEQRVNKLVFIGRNLDRSQLEAGFRACLVPCSAARPGPWRWPIG
jgi:G3E family GTPase